MASIEMPTYTEMLNAFNEANRLREKLAERERQLANVQSHYSRLKAMYAKLKGETKKPAKMQSQIITCFESGLHDYHAVAERVGCTYGYVKSVLSIYKRALENDR